MRTVLPTSPRDTSAATGGATRDGNQSMIAGTSATARDFPRPAATNPLAPVRRSRLRAQASGCVMAAVFAYTARLPMYVFHSQAGVFGKLGLRTRQRSGSFVVSMTFFRPIYQTGGATTVSRRKPRAAVRLRLCRFPYQRPRHVQACRSGGVAARTAIQASLSVRRGEWFDAHRSGAGYHTRDSATAERQRCSAQGRARVV